MIVASGCDEPPARRGVPPAEYRVERWQFLVREERLSPSETVRLMRVPSAVDPGARDLDQFCILYTNAEWQTAQLSCPNSL